MKKKYFILSIIISICMFMEFPKAQEHSSFNKDNLHFLADIYNESWAVIIGINDYKHMPNLNYAVNDAISVKEMLMKNYNYREDHIKLILNENATKNGILTGFNELLEIEAFDGSFWGLFQFWGYCMIIVAILQLLKALSVENF